MQEKTTKDNLKTLVENSPLLIYMKDKNLNYQTGSKYADDFVFDGYDKHTNNNLHINMKEVEDLTTKEDSYVINNKRELIKEKVAKDMNGISHWYQIYKAPILTDDGNCDGLVTIARNIDKEKEIEYQKEMFIATLTHDIKNPLQGQISILNLLLENEFGELTKEQKNIIEAIVESETYMNNMLLTLLDSYKADNGAIKLNKSRFSVNEFVDNCIKEVKITAKNKNIKLEKEIEENLDINADKIQLRRVISNILINGLDYAYENTTIKICAYKNKNKTVLTIQNKSPEIPEEIKQNLFNKYVTGANKYRKIGFGLGLYLSKQIIDAHNGEIYLDANKEDNKFVFEIPD